MSDPFNLSLCLLKEYGPAQVAVLACQRASAIPGVLKHVYKKFCNSSVILKVAPSRITLFCFWVRMMTLQGELEQCSFKGHSNHPNSTWWSSSSRTLHHLREITMLAIGRSLLLSWPEGTGAVVVVMVLRGECFWIVPQLLVHQCALSVHYRHLYLMIVNITQGFQK